MNRLKYTVTFIKGGVVHTFTPDDDVPEWAVPLINPERFVDEAPEPAAAPEPAESPNATPHPRKRTAQPKA